MFTLLISLSITWNYYNIRGRYFHRGKPEVAMYVNIATAVITDLGIDRPIREAPAPGPSAFGGRQGPKHMISTITNEDRRAMLSWYITYSL